MVIVVKYYVRCFRSIHIFWHCLMQPYDKIFSKCTLFLLLPYFFPLKMLIATLCFSFFFPFSLCIFSIFMSTIWVDSGDASSVAVRSTGRMELRHGILRFMGIVRPAGLYSQHTESMRNITRSILGHHKTTRVWCQTNAKAYDAVCGTGLVGRRLHFTSTALDSRQRTL